VEQQHPQDGDGTKPVELQNLGMGHLGDLSFAGIEIFRGSPLAQCWPGETSQAVDLSACLVALTCQLDLLEAAVLAGFSCVGTKTGR